MVRLIVALLLFAQSAVGKSVGVGSRFISPTVVATTLTTTSPSGTTLDLLVLWRGSPGWFLASAPEGAKSGGWSGGSIGQPTIVHQENVFGDVRLIVEFNPDTSVATIQGREISLQGAQVVLVDQIDSDTAVFLGTRTLADGRLPDEHQLYPLFQQSAELQAFLQCDVALADAFLHQVVRQVCVQTIGDSVAPR
jgi:hypothetical protein